MGLLDIIFGSSERPGSANEQEDADRAADNQRDSDAIGNGGDQTRLTEGYCVSRDAVTLFNSKMPYEHFKKEYDRNQKEQKELADYSDYRKANVEAVEQVVGLAVTDIFRKAWRVLTNKKHE